MVRRYLIQFLLIFSFGCNFHSEKKVDAISPEKTVIDFIKWYDKNYDSISSIVPVTYTDFKKGDTTKYYTLDFEASEKYLSKLKVSGFLSEEYFNEQRKYFLH